MWRSVAKFLEFTKNLQRRQDGAVAVIVALLLSVLLGSTAISIGFGAIQNARISTHASAEALALEAARLCQSSQTDCVPATLKTKLSSLAAANGVTITTVSAPTVDSSDPTNRSKLQVAVQRNWSIPLLEIIRDSNSMMVQTSAWAAWTNQASMSQKAKADYLPLMVSDCVAKKLSIPNTDQHRLYDNGHCTGGSAPAVWFFGNAGSSDGSCWTNNQGPTLEIGDTVQNPSEVAPTTKTCELNADYWVPVYQNYQTTQSVEVTTYKRTWLETLTYRNGAKTETVGPRTHVKNCDSSTSTIDDEGCAYVSGYPSPSAALVCPAKKNCTGPIFTENRSLMVTSTSTQVEEVVPFGTVSGFMKVHIVSIVFQNILVNNRAVPDHIFVIQYAGRDIRLVAN